MDDIVCEGDEKSLTECVFSGWGSSDCESNEAAGVICNDKIKNSIPVKIEEEEKIKIHEVVDVRTVSLRLVGGRSSSEGRVEVRLQKNIFYDCW